MTARSGESIFDSQTVIKSQSLSSVTKSLSFIFCPYSIIPKTIDMSNQQADRIVHALSGGLGGAAALVVTYPLVAISCHQQTNNKSSQDSKDKEEKREKPQQQQQQQQQVTSWELVKDIFKTDGIGGFYAGMESAIYGMALTNFVYYYFYESTGRVLVKNRHLQKISDFSFKDLGKIALQGLSPKESIITGAIAGSITATVTNPFWVVNTRTTVSKTSKSFLRVLFDVYEKEGIKSFFNGVLPALVLVINPIIQYTVFEQIKNLILKKKRDGFRPVDAFFLGAFSKLVATSITYPYITLKSRMHLQNNDKKKDGSAKAKRQSDSMTGLLLSIVKNEGFAGLYNGIFVKLSQSIFTAAFLFFFKEELVNLTLKLVLLLKRAKQKRIASVVA